MFNTGWKNWKTVNVYPLKKRKTSSTWIGKLQVSSRNLGKQLMQLWWKLIEAAREDLRFQTRSFQNILWVKLASWSSCLLLACLDLCLETLDHHLQKIRCCSCWPRATSIYIYIYTQRVCMCDVSMTLSLDVDGAHRQLKFERVASACLCCSSAEAAFKANDCSDLWALAISRISSV